MMWRYRIGKKVGVVRFDVKRNRDYIDSGKIIARRWVGYGWRYVVRFKDETIKYFDHDELWTSFEK